VISIKFPIDLFITRLYSVNLVKIGDFPLKGGFSEFDHAPERKSKFFLIITI